LDFVLNFVYFCESGHNLGALKSDNQYVHSLLPAHTTACFVRKVGMCIFAVISTPCFDDQCKF